MLTIPDTKPGNPHPTSDPGLHQEETTIPPKQAHTRDVKDSIERLICAESCLAVVAGNWAPDVPQRQRLNVLRGRVRAEITVLKAELGSLLGYMATDDDAL